MYYIQLQIHYDFIYTLLIRLCILYRSAPHHVLYLTLIYIFFRQFIYIYIGVEFLHFSGKKIFLVEEDFYLHYFYQTAQSSNQCQFLTIYRLDSFLQRSQSQNCLSKIQTQDYKICQDLVCFVLRHSFENDFQCAIVEHSEKFHFLKFVTLEGLVLYRPHPPIWVGRPGPPVSTPVYIYIYKLKYNSIIRL
eukprot:TRINITY_DN1216_c0_g1_i7.p1 TRINITY_DN1216_c0_g1~~TRINITY_DN1216_c0_g1_i7.p1  ORF type:complete len:214 (-),score=-20.14 TRINITY_DN1216_c0_g1_i7:1978-2550(-)